MLMFALKPLKSANAASISVILDTSQSRMWLPSECTHVVVHSRKAERSAVELSGANAAAMAAIAHRSARRTLFMSVARYVRERRVKTAFWDSGSARKLRGTLHRVETSKHLEIWR